MNIDKTVKYLKEKMTNRPKIAIILKCLNCMKKIQIWVNRANLKFGV